MSDEAKVRGKTYNLYYPPTRFDMSFFLMETLEMLMRHVLILHRLCIVL